MKSTKEKIALSANFSGRALEAGLDEAGRGCLAGPVMAAAVILPPDYSHLFLNDSKLLTKKQREMLREEIYREAIGWSVGEVTPAHIDEINILQASFLAMHRAVAQLSPQPEYLIVDGHLFNPYPGIPDACLVKGDSRYFSIAAASVLAKTFRDDRMAELAKLFPGYGWEQNAGYPTIQHRQAIEKQGATPHHRFSFRLLPEVFSSVS